MTADRGKLPTVKVFIIDDDPTMVTLLHTLLELEGYQVATAEDWADIAGAAMKANPDVVLMDYFLPGTDGRKVLVALRSTPGYEHLSIIMTSGMDREDECLEAGADAFLLKPYSPDHLLETIRDLSRIDGKNNSPEKA